MFKYLVKVGTFSKKFTNYDDAMEFFKINWAPGLAWSFTKLF